MPSWSAWPRTAATAVSDVPQRRLALADGRSESPGETKTRFLLHQHGIWVPALQIDVETRLGLFRLDLGWPQLRVGLEYDGLVKYTRDANCDPAQVVFEEIRRQDAIEEEGWSLIRVTSADHRAPAELASRVRVTLDRAARRRVRPPSGIETVSSP